MDDSDVSDASVAGDEADGPVIGIVIGSTNNRIWIYRNKRVVIITDETGVDPIPDVIAFTDSGIKFGQNANDLMSRSLKNTISGCIRLMGQNERELASDLKDSDIRVLDENTIEVTVNGSTQEYTTTQLLGLQIEYLKETAETYLGQVTKVVITVPFTACADSSIRSAVESAGLKMEKLIEKPVAAVTAYDLDKRDGFYLVFHCGSRTTSAAVVQVKDEDSVVHVSKDGFGCSGESMDQILLNHCLNLFQEQNGCDMSGDAAAVSRLREEVQLAKVRLSSRESVHIQMMGLYEGKDFSAKIMRSQLETMCYSILKSAVSVMDKAVHGIKSENIQRVILIGGSCKIPKLRSMVQSKFGVGKVLFDETDMTVCHGSAAHAGLVTYPLTDMNSIPDDPWIGIDLGTTYSLVGVWNNRQVDIIANESGKKITPSVVAFKTENNETEILIGDEAKDNLGFDPRNTIYDTKRLIGRRFDDPEVQSDIQDLGWTFTVEKGDDGNPMVKVIGEGRLTPEYLSSLVIARLVSMAEIVASRPLRLVVTHD